MNPGRHPAAAPLVGAAAGWATAVGNAAGSIMAIYFVMMGFPKKNFLGTAALCFAVGNWIKLPVFAGIGIVDKGIVWSGLSLLPAVAAGALLGRDVLYRIPQQIFETVVLILAAAAALMLLV